MRSSELISGHEWVRRRSGYTITGLAAAVGYSHAYISQVENGRRTASRRYREAVARVLEVPEHVLFGGAE